MEVLILKTRQSNHTTDLTLTYTTTMYYFNVCSQLNAEQNINMQFGKRKRFHQKTKFQLVPRLGSLVNNN